MAIYEGRIDEGAAAAVREGHVLELAGLRCIVDQVSRYPDFRMMLDECGLEKTLPGVRSVDAGVAVYHAFPHYAEKAAASGVVAFKLRLETATSRPLKITVADIAGTPHQWRFWEAGKQAIDHALAVYNADTNDEAARLVEETLVKVAACFGPPGTGKTAVSHLLIEYAPEQGCEVLFALPTAQLSSRMREKYATHTRRADITFNTCHAAMGLDEPFVNIPTLARFQLVLVDEISQLQGHHSDQILKLRGAADCVPGMLLVGDKWQMAGAAVAYEVVAPLCAFYRAGHCLQVQGPHAPHGP